MKKILLVIFFTTSLFLVKSQEINFKHVDGPEELDSAIKTFSIENKMFMLSFSSDECEPCQDVNNETYKDKSVIKCLDENFIMIKVDVDNRNNYPLISKYQVDRIPYFVFLNSIGNEIGYEAGNLPPQDMIDVCETYTSLYNQMFDIREAYLKNQDDLLTVAAYALILEELAYYDKGFEIAKEYHAMYDSLMFTKDEWQILNLYGPRASVSKTRQVIKNLKEIEEKFNHEEINFFLIDAFQMFYDMALEQKDQKLLEEALNIIPLVDYGGESVPVVQMQEYFVLKYYQEIEDWKNYSEYAVYFIGKYPLEDTDIAEVIYNFYYFVEDKQMLKLAFNWSETLVEKEESFSNLIAYGMMLYKSGDADKANKYLDKATKIAETNDQRQIILQLSQEFNK